MYVCKTIVMFMNENVISLLDQAEDMEVIDIHKMRISQQIPMMVEFDIEVDPEYYEDLVTVLNEETLAFELRN